MRSRRGFTIMELMIAAVIGMIIALGAGFAYSSAVTFQIQAGQRRQESERLLAVQNELLAWLNLATLSTDPASPNTYFIGQQGSGTQSNEASNSLTFTVLGDRVRGTLLDSTDAFETLNQTHGPQGGFLEVQVGAEPIGEAPNTEGGTFVRLQRPADGDPTQGGRQRVLAPEITDVTFEFYDGEAWQTGWDTREQDQPRLPAAIRLTYTWQDETERRTLLARLPNSDVTVDDPATATGGAQ